MNRNQAVTVIAAAANLLLILLFPPYDCLGHVQSNVPTFDGFLFVFGDHPNRTLNDNFLYIELTTVLINAAIAWLLLRRQAGRGLGAQNLVLLAVALNLLLALLFPPFENYYALTKAVLPSFDGFYFVFDDNSMRVIVAPILWLEIIFILVNGAMLWLLLRKGAPQEMTAAERFAQTERQLRASARKKI